MCVHTCTSHFFYEQHRILSLDAPYGASKRFHHPTIVVHLQFLFLTTHPACTRAQRVGGRPCQSAGEHTITRIFFTSHGISLFANPQLENDQTIYCPLWPRGTATNPFLFAEDVWLFYKNEDAQFRSPGVKRCFVLEIILSPTMKKRRPKQSSEMKKSRRWFFSRNHATHGHKHRRLHTTTIAWRPWWRFGLPWSLPYDRSIIDQKSAKSTTPTEKIRAILLPKNGGGGTHSSQQLVRYHVHDMWPSVHDAWLFSRKMHVATYSIWDSRVRYYQQILWFHDFTR